MLESSTAGEIARAPVLSLSPSSMSDQGQPTRDSGAARKSDELIRNSPASAVCNQNFEDLEAYEPRVKTSTPPAEENNKVNEKTTAFIAGEESDHTPRSEIPSAVESPAVWQSLPASSSSHDNINQPLESGYFSPRPLKYHLTPLPPRSNDVSATPSPVPSTNASTTSIDRSHFEPTTHPSDVDSERPSVYRDASSSSTATNSTVRPLSFLYPLETSREYPQFPNQAYSALQSQNHPFFHPPHIHPPHALWNRTSFTAQHSHSTFQVATLAHPLNHDRIESGSRTVGNSPSSSPGLFSPSTQAIKTTDGEGFYSSPYLHPVHRQAPKETHVADVDFDPISGRKIINQYEVIDELGRGVHGKVKLGRNMDSGKFVAIKIVERFSKKRRLGKNNSFEDKIRKEIAILKKARHPNIVSLLEVIDDPTVKKVYIILEHVELGEVKWRIEGAKEIALIEYRRYEREARGIFESDSAAIEDEQIFTAATRRRERKERRRWKELHRRNQSLEHEAWSFEHGGDSDDEGSDYNSLSRASTATAHQGDVGHTHSEVDGVMATDVTAKAARDFASSPVTLPSSSRASSSTGLEGTMYGAYEVEVARGRTPSITGSASSASLDLDHIDLIPEHFRYVPLLTLTDVRRAIRDTILGLEYLHYQGVVHRDIKPANLLQTKDHRIKISDFGVSYLGRSKADDNTAGDVSESDAPDVDEAIELAKTVGTPAFYAPELCRTDEDADALEVTQAIDVWAVGVTLYCLVFGRVPFHDENPFVLMRKIADEPVYIPRRRLKAVDEQAGSRPNSHGRYYNPMNSNKRAPHDLDYEEVDEELCDFLQQLLEKDPRKRITLKAAKMHDWLLRDIVNPEDWFNETEPETQMQGRRIELTKEDISAAVVPLTFKDKVISGLRKIGNLVGRSSSTRGRRDRAKSSATPSEGLPSSTASSSSTISQDARRDARRPSLRVDEQFFAALKSSRENEHPLSQSLTASPEAGHHGSFFEGFSSRPHSPNIDISETRNALHRALTNERTHTAMSTAASTRTIRAADTSRGSSRLTSPLQLSALPSAPLPLESPNTSNLGGIFGGAARRAPDTMRNRDRSASVLVDHNRERSIDRLVGADDNPHAQPSIALSGTVAAGHVNLPEVLRETPKKHGISSDAHSPQTIGHGHSDRLYPESATNTPSRQSSISSVSSHFYETYHGAHEDRPSTRGSGVPSSINRGNSEEQFARAREEFVRRRILEHGQSSKESEASISRPSSALSQSACPPSPDDEIMFQKQKEAEERAGSSLETSPLSGPVNARVLTASSSEDHFASGLSQSTSNPSIPSVISANSSIAAEDTMPADRYKVVAHRSSDDTLNPTLTQQPHYGGFAHDHRAESADDEDDSESEEEFIELRRPNRRLKSIPGRTSSVAVAEHPRESRRSPTSSRTTGASVSPTSRAVTSSPDTPTAAAEQTLG